MATKAKKHYSLKWQLIVLVLCCWLVPMLLIISTFAYYAEHNLKRQVVDTVQTSANHAAATALSQLQGVVSASRNATYDGWAKAAYQKYQRSGDRSLAYDELQRKLAQNYKYEDSIHSAIFFFTIEPESLYYTFNPISGAGYEDIVFYQEKVHDAAQDISRALDTGIAFHAEADRVFLIRNIVNHDFEPYSVLVFELNLSKILQHFQSIVWETRATVFLNGTPVALLDDGRGRLEMGSGPALGEAQTMESANYLTVFGGDKLDAVELRYLVEVDKQGFMQGFQDYFWIFYLLLLMLLPLLALVLFFSYRNIFTPINRLVAATASIEQGNLGYQMEDPVHNIEFYYLGESFNAMSVKLKQQFERLYSEELALRDARIMALQSQINPHFLNNTLEIINWEVRLGNNTKVSGMIESLATMLDAAMDRKSAPTVALSQELMYADAYLHIITERYGKRILVNREVDVNLLPWHVPRLILQPILENAVEHGMSPQQTCHINLSIKGQDSHMLIEVQNEGVLSDQNREAIRNLLSPRADTKYTGSLQLGIRNTNMRLKMIYGEGYGLSIHERDGWTIASILIPLKGEAMSCNQMQ